jgi:hypothetical protein
MSIIEPTGGCATGGGWAHSPPKPSTPPATPEDRINLTDPDSRVVKGLRGFAHRELQAAGVSDTPGACCWRTSATGINGRWSGSSTAAFKC